MLVLFESPAGYAIFKDKLDINCVSNTNVQELRSCIRSQMDGLISGIPSSEMAKMTLGLAHSLARYKLKFSPDKVDTMIIQAISLLDDLDKELNNYMRCKEWYSWHFPELLKIITDNTVYVLAVKAIGLQTNAARCDLSECNYADTSERIFRASENMWREEMMRFCSLCFSLLFITTTETRETNRDREMSLPLLVTYSRSLGKFACSHLHSHTLRYSQHFFV
ncbi:nucleolar protein 58-like isoform X2 [Centruroides vittatus]|uniref:nucleolar protein 58-like isoform X2 n=1 Tax=Centruroides vittatus TaxID=120091 RepID=UPI00350FD962